MDPPIHRVYTRARWDNPWTLNPHLRCTWCQFACSPDISRAELEYEFGQILRPGAVRFEDYAPLEINTHFVKIEIEITDQPGEEPSFVRWYGRIWEMETDRGGIHSDLIDGMLKQTPMGNQRFDCLGLEFELDRLHLESSVVERSGDYEAPEDVVARVNRVIGINRGGGNSWSSDLHAEPNRSPQRSTSSPYVFAYFLYEAELWRANEFLEYLLIYHVPGPIAWMIDPDGQLEFLKWWAPTLELTGLTIKQVFDTLIDRRRLSTWTVRVVEQENDVDKVLIHVASLTPNDITSQFDGQVLPGNPNQKTLDFDRAFDVQAAVHVESALHVADYVKVVGSRRTSTFTVHSVRDTNLYPGWSDGEQQLYNQGASNRPEYANADRSTKERMNDIARAEPAVRRVFTHFELTYTWRGRVNSPIDGDWGEFVVNPKLDASGDPTTESAEFWHEGIRFAQYLPLKVDVDYSQSVTDPPPFPGIPADAETRYMSPFAVVKFPLDRQSESDPDYEAVYLHKVAAQSRDELEGDGGRAWSGGLTIRDDAPGFIIEIASPNQHKIGKSDTSDNLWQDRVFVPLPDVEEIEPEVRWYKDLFVTVCWPTDGYVEVVWPENAQVDEGIGKRIELGDEYRLDYLAPRTVTGLQDGKMLINADGGFVRDDRAKMRSLAQVAYEWYSRKRQAFSLTISQLFPGLLVGDLITQIGSGDHTVTVNSAVTGIKYDLVGMTTAIATDFGDLDLHAFGERIRRRG
ncbi:MAG: hypothetical protein JNG90_19470 [Planctomycetaceae bacterium]|nr:hypothetical protein [Planctomycetaceae bacterium]